ncbi:MAG: NAD-dependent epimerase/dehydratase family protein [Candidatus Thermoplasmatota archaeon]|nr:NAD-dependent epimerase/dehydratase family protein [Candidatus Thermoplasmatota archaeon]MCL5793944.1 NAD-dependent epimerase/dehydratase family protein [Candidatus Thermoplasmatota archaeon]
MKALILGVDGYIGWPLALRLLNRGHEVAGADSFFTRRRVREVESDSAIPIGTMGRRLAALKENGLHMEFLRGDVSNAAFVYRLIEETKPDVVVHLAEQRSAPYSMLGLKQASDTMYRNVISTLNLSYALKDLSPGTHILKLGTMGEYGTPNIEIPEGFFDIEYKGRKDSLPFPKFAGSWYHWTKVHDSNNLMFANRLWKLPVTDVMQGVVYGTRTRDITDTSLFTRFDIDEVWGTALNRFCAQAVAGLPITPYGKGGQTRGFLSLEDSITCLTLAAENPPEEGEYRVFNQFDQHYSVNQLATYVKEEYERTHEGKAEIVHVENPRVEKEEHFYQPVSEKLRHLGYHPSGDLRVDLRSIMNDLEKFREKILSLKKVITPRTFWKSSSGLSEKPSGR